MGKQLIKTQVRHLNMIPATDGGYDGVAKKWDSSTSEYKASDITGGTITLTVKKKDASLWGDQTLWKTFDGNLTTPASGLYEIVFLDTDSSDEDLGVYDHRIEYIDAGGLKHLLAIGDFRIGY